jgi:hypothetical protein
MSDRLLLLHRQAFKSQQPLYIRIQQGAEGSSDLGAF